MTENRGFWCRFDNEKKCLDSIESPRDESPGEEYTWIEEVAEYIWDDRVVQDAQDTKEKKADISLLQIVSEMKNSPKSQILTDCLRVAIWAAIDKNEVEIAVMITELRRQLMIHSSEETIR